VMVKVVLVVNKMIVILIKHIYQKILALYYMCQPVPVNHLVMSVILINYLLYL